jgi:hypothetical protein
MDRDGAYSDPVRILCSVWLGSIVSNEDYHPYTWEEPRGYAFLFRKG